MNKILLVDDNQSIHDDFHKILSLKNDVAEAFHETASMLFNTDSVLSKKGDGQDFVLDSAFQGEEALELVKKSITMNEPYALAFVDIRIPPGWDGVVTIKKLWEVDPNIQMVICSAYSDYSLEEITNILNGQDNLLILKKPFDVIEVRQLASALLKKWELTRQVQLQIKNLEQAVAERTKELQKANINLDKSLSLTRATIESTQEGILVLDQNETILIYNQKFLNLWNISLELMTGKSFEVLKKLAAQVENPSELLTVILNLCKKPKTEHVKELKLRTGQIFELYSHCFSHGLNDSTQGVVLSFREITEHKRLEEELLHLATHDVLTGLPNRIILMDRLQQAINYAKRNGLFVGVLMLDLDNFKQINDTLGHKAGDELLNLVAINMKNCFRESDTITRFGGDEFVIILPAQVNLKQFTLMAESLKEMFNRPLMIKDYQIKITGSMGISIYPLDGEIPEELLKNADAALYHAKEIGKNDFQFYTTELNDNLLKQVELESGLITALDKNEFVLFYQPLLNINSNKIIGLEALLRWNHPTLGLLAPNNFISIAEKTGLIIPIGNWVLRTACFQAKKWQETLSPDLTIAVNVSGKQILQRDFIQVVEKAIKDSGLAPYSLELEITEHVILENSSHVSNTMKILKDMGIRLVMDDFGIGYSSLNYIKLFPFDKIKIDKSFTQGINTNVDDKNIVEAIINMTKSMGLQVLAEGVETKEQLEFLRKQHSNQIQGYYISPPLESSQLIDFLEEFK
ncbi:regulatory protein (GGDEF and EAL domains) [Legionella beliardensis]|uniref:Regulatory protein (GGDEF and EAL domains) n=1 Tax=Legionella beliardensis TaxID=91822 RepID=A0A378IBP1_9GAMM|nr:EAL domain-containing protein [Legionella beliardensis]STX29714.1 regulatory protein (GGDEF and EAL domains) [Legionella beliardensis]